MECEDESRPLLNGDERVCVEKEGLLCVRLTLGEAWQRHFFIRKGRGAVKISAELSISADYMHVAAVKESEGKKVSVK